MLVRKSALILILSFLSFSAAFGADCNWYLSAVQGREKTKAEELNSELFFRLGYARPPLEQMKAFYESSVDFNTEYRLLTGRTEFEFNDLEGSLKKSVLDAYYNIFMKRFKDPERLARLRSDSIKRSLEGHGYKTDPAKTGQEELKALSQANVKRILESLPYWSEFKKTVDVENPPEDFHVGFTRNGRSRAFGDFILSSQQLFKYSGNLGENSVQVFNREQLQSDDNIFFLVGMKEQFEAEKKDLSVYGAHAFYLNSLNYAKEHGIISPFIMWPQDLANIARRIGWSEGVDFNKVPKGEENQYIEIWRKKLYTLDFTVSDFLRLTSLYRLYEKFHLEKLHQDIVGTENTQERYSQLRKAMQEFFDRSDEYRSALEMLEMRIPVAAPVGIFSEVR